MSEYEDISEELDLTPIEQLETAHLACRTMWLWPDDTGLLLAAVEACGALGIDYIEAIHTLERKRMISTSEARRMLAESIRHAADEAYAEYGMGHA